MIELIPHLLGACLFGNLGCEPIQKPISFVNEGKACYVQGIFYEQCPQPEVRVTVPRRAGYPLSPGAETRYN